MSLFTLFGISNAYAATAAPAPSTTGGLISFLPMILIFVLFIFLMMRPQMKRAKEHRALISALSLGDEVLTTGGMLGKISKLQDNFVVLSLGKELDIMLQKNAIAQVLPKGTMDSLHSN